MKQTAVEWLDNNLKSLISEDGAIYDFKRKVVELFEQAKAMEKKYLERFYNQGYTQCSIEDLELKSRERFVDAEDYYNKTFKSE